MILFNSLLYIDTYMIVFRRCNSQKSTINWTYLFVFLCKHLRFEMFENKGVIQLIMQIKVRFMFEITVQDSQMYRLACAHVILIQLEVTQM